MPTARGSTSGSAWSGRSTPRAGRSSNRRRCSALHRERTGRRSPDKAAVARRAAAQALRSQRWRSAVACPASRSRPDRRDKRDRRRDQIWPCGQRPPQGRGEATTDDAVALVGLVRSAVPAVARTAARCRRSYTGDGTGVTPPLEWSGAPAGTKSYALIMHHTDAQGDR